MKTFLRMAIFTIIGISASFTVASVVFLITWRPLAPEMAEAVARGDRSASLHMALESEKVRSVPNVVLWPVALGIAYGFERFWRSWRRQPAKRFPGWLRWSGAVVAGLLTAIWVDSAYTLWLVLTFPENYLAQPALYEREIASFGQQLESAKTITLLVWVIATVIFGVLSSRSAVTEPDPSLRHQLS